MAKADFESLPYLAGRLREYANTLVKGGFVEPPKILNEASRIVENGTATEATMRALFERLQNEVWREFCDEAWKKPILDQVDFILRKSTLPKLSLTMSILDQATKPQETCNQIVVLALQQTDKLLKMQLLCFAYLILVEGVYDQHTLPPS